MRVTNALMRVFAFVFPLIAVALLAACPADLTEVCSLSGAVPDNTENGQGSATVDGTPFDGNANWSPGSTASITVGLLSMIVAKDVTGTDFDALISDGALPICVTQGEQSGTTGAANLVDDGGFVTDAEHTGNVAILSFADDVLVGRFEVTVVNNANGEVRAFTDGVFAATRFE